MPRLCRVAHVGRLVVGDGHALRAEHLEGRGDGLGARRVGRRPTAPLIRGHDVDTVPATPDPVAAEHERELPLDVGRDHGAGLDCASPEPAQRPSTGSQAGLLVVAAHEALVRPGQFEHLVELRFAHHMALRVPVMEELDRLVERPAIDDRVVRRQRHAQDVGVLVLERTGQVVVDLVEAQRQRLADRPVRRGGGRRGGIERGQTLQRCVAPRARAGGAGAGGQVEGLEHERRDPPRPSPAVVCRMR